MLLRSFLTSVHFSPFCVLETGLLETGLDLHWRGVGERGLLELLPLGHLGSLLQLVVVDDVLVGGAALRERVQRVHLAEVLPQRAHVAWKTKVTFKTSVRSGFATFKRIE